MHIATHILNKILQYVCVGILHIQLDLYTERNLLFNIISLSHMSDHISKSELFCNKRNTVKLSTLDQNISILEMSCGYKKNMWYFWKVFIDNICYFFWVTACMHEFILIINCIY